MNRRAYATDLTDSEWELLMCDEPPSFSESSPERHRTNVYAVHFAIDPRIVAMHRTVDLKSPKWRLLAKLAFAILLIVTGLPSASAQRLLSPEAGWTETWVSRFPVAGELRMGVMTLSDNPSIDPRLMHVLLPATALARLCVQVNSSDGRYHAELRYDVRRVAAGPVGLRMPTRHRRHLSRYQPDQLVILAHLGNYCDGDAESFVVAGWHEVVPGDILIFLNSRVPAYVLAVERGEAKHGTLCLDLPGSSITFNLRCRVRHEWLNPATRLFVRQRERQGARSFFVDVPLAIEGWTGAHQ